MPLSENVEEFAKKCIKNCSKELERICLTEFKGRKMKRRRVRQGEEGMKG
jgi:hypothetical protein